MKTTMIVLGLMLAASLPSITRADMRVAGPTSLPADTLQIGGELAFAHAAAGSFLALASTDSVTAHPDPILPGVETTASSASRATASAPVQATGLAFIAAPVPESDTWAMVALGFGLVGMLIRRKSTATLRISS